MPIFAGASRTKTTLMVATAVVVTLAAMMTLAARRRRPTRTVAILVDNGSLVAPSFLNLRTVAAAFTAHTGVECIPASFRFSDRVDPALLNGQPAVLLGPALAATLADATVAQVVILPFFLGPSDTVYVDIARVAAAASTANVPVRVADVLVDMADPADTFVADALCHNVRQVLASLATTNAQDAASPPHIILCDHGTPSRAVNAVRAYLAAQLAHALGLPVTAASMERRDGAEYDFNEPLLERACLPPLSGDVVVALAFMSPGRHAGAGGDIATILARSEAANPHIRSHMTSVLGAHPRIIACLASRFHAAQLKAAPCPK